MPKNLVFICADQMRFDGLSINGNPVVETVNIDRIGRAGVSLKRHHTPNQICSPSRATMATGLLPRHHGLWRNGAALDEAVPTLWQHLTKAGYRTGAAGKLHFQPLLAPAEAAMPESLVFWDKPRAEDWHGPYYGFGHVDLVLGEANESTKAGHYANWLRRNHPDVPALYQPDAIPGSQASDLTEVWRSAVPAELHYTNWIADRGIDFIEASGKSDDPFALFVSFPDPHHPFAPPGEYADLFRPEDMPPPTIREGELDRMPAYLQFGDDPKKEAYIGAGEKVREQGFMLRTETISPQTLSRAIAHTYGMIKMIDDAVGRILCALKRCGAADETLVVFTTDHGEFLGDHGLLRKGPPPYRQLLHVPMCISGPGVRETLSPDRLTSHVDLPSTLAALLDAPSFETRDGFDLTSHRARECLFAEYHPRADADLYNHSIITRDWRLTLYPNQHSWGELFDLNADPGEHWNLFHEKSCAETRSLLERLLLEGLPPQPHIQSNIWGAY
ncbi:MAG: arylsulfatase [Mesorhizobium amorphae]|nr:MAG: arylsulfatase [Mesorhizobium amorphae]